ncbi:MAG: septation protein A [Beijerinckiaceae bacterium]|nr:septation protein A [Beijerinckiaceae bacterium]
MTEIKTDQKKKLNPLLRLAFDLGPLAVFFIGYTFGDFFVATAIFMVSLFVSMALSYFLTRHLPVMSIVSGIIVAVFGGLTLFLHDETFFRMKPTIIYALFGSLLLGGLMLGKPLIAAVLGEAVDLTEEGWKILSLRWGVFFFVLAAMNEAVRLGFPDYWVQFKVFGATALTIGFAMLQTPVMMKYERKKDEND